jgi:hypothetical protein
LIALVYKEFPNVFAFRLKDMASKGYLAIPEENDKLITILRTVYANELSLDKEQTSYSDLMDSLRLSLKAYNFK